MASTDAKYKKYAMTEARVLDLIKPTITDIEIPSTSKDYKKENIIPRISIENQPTKRTKQQSSDDEEPIERKKQTKAEVARNRPRISGRFVSKETIKEDNVSQMR